ncbi:MAG: hypothetical protein WCW02_00990 [Candidatus Buchananbacteria bacterium]
MKKLLLGLLSLIFLIVVIVAVMLVFKLCPPAGPWPTPPWCRGDFVVDQYQVKVSPTKLSPIKAVNMYDTWGRNYNQSMFETTQANIDRSFDRVKALGAQEVYVHDFDRAIYDDKYDPLSINYKLVDETFWNDFRDQSISQAELVKLVQSAHQRGLKLGIKRNLAFVNIGKYLWSGLSGKISSEVQKDYEAFNSSHSEAWIKDFFQKWQERLVAKGKMYQAAGVDSMTISPMFQDPTFAGQEDLANGLWKNLITELRKSFTGQIMVDLNVYGFIDGNNGAENWQKYDYYKQADIVEVRIYKILEKYQTKFGFDQSKMQTEISAMVAELDAKARAAGIRLSVFYAPSSYQNSIFAGPVEYLDVKNPAIKNLIKDYDEQARAFDYFFVAVNGKQNIVRLNAGNFAWDDALDPAVMARVSISASFRNKPAEQVVKAWFSKE